MKMKFSDPGATSNIDEYLLGYHDIPFGYPKYSYLCGYFGGSIYQLYDENNRKITFYHELETFILFMKLRFIHKPEKELKQYRQLLDYYLNIIDKK